MRLLLRFLDWRREMLLWMIAAMDVCWLYPWVFLLMSVLSGPERVLSITSMLVLLLLAVYVVRTLNNLQLSLLRQQLITIAIGLSAILLIIRWELYGYYSLLSLRWIGQLVRDIAAVELALPPQILIFFVGLFLWWRGIRIGQTTWGSGTVGVHFRGGIVAFMLYLIVAAFGIPLPYARLLLGFFFFGLIAVALARINDLNQSRLGIRAPFNSSWLGILLGSAALMVLFGFFASSIFSLENLQAAFRGLRPITEPLREISFYVIFVFIYIAAVVVGYLVAWLRSLLGTPQEKVEMPRFEFGDIEKFAEQIDMARLMAWVKVGRDILLVVVILVAILAVFFSVRRYLGRRAAGRDVVRESLWSSEDFMDDLADLLRGGWRRLRDGAAAGLARLRGERYSLVSIRKIYASLVELATECGFPRRDAQTPYEYVSVLQEAWPAQSEDVRLLTEAYVQAHYGQRADRDDALQWAREAWSRLYVARPPVKKPAPPPLEEDEDISE